MIERKTYPNAHPAWLEVMGVGTRWQLRDAHHAVDAEQMGVMLPEEVLQAQCCILVPAPLSVQQRAFLATMLWSAGWQMDDVLCWVLDSSAAPSESMYQQATEWTVWPQLPCISMSVAQSEAWLDALAESSTALRIWIFGLNDQFSNTGAQIEHLPDLTQLMTHPQLKKQAWLRIQSRISDIL